MRLELTRRGDYGVRAMLALARAPGTELMSVRRIAEAMAIPVRFLPQVMADLGRAGLVEAMPGRSGGYRLQRRASEITILDVIEATEGDSRRHTCVLRGGPCGADGACDVHDIFFAAQDAMLGILGSATLDTVPSRRSGGIRLEGSGTRAGRRVTQRAGTERKATNPQAVRLACRANDAPSSRGGAK